jgi:hypothetical protein
MSPTVQGIYNDFIESLPPTDHSKNDVSTKSSDQSLQPNDFVLDQKDYWTDEDKADIISFSWQHVVSLFPDEDVA